MGLVVLLILVFFIARRCDRDLVAEGVEEVVDIGIGMGRVMW